MMGNHDLDSGVPVFSNLVQNLNISWVMSNFKLKTNNQDIAFNRDYYVFHKNQLKVGILALVDENYFDSLAQPQPFVLEDPFKRGQEVVSILKKEKCDLIICLTHMLNSSDRLLADKLEGVDLFLGGHEHCYMIYKNSKSLSVKSGSNFETFNDIKLTFAEHSLVQAKETLPGGDSEDPADFWFFEKSYNPENRSAFQFSLQKS